MKTLPAGSTIGILGGGQLGRMTAMAAACLGYHVHVFCQSRDEPAVEVSAQQTFAAFDDTEALARFALSVDVVTLEWENVPLQALETVAQHTLLAPSARVMGIAQDRGLEKSFARSCDVGTADFMVVHNVGELEVAMQRIGVPSILKSTRMGYDGHGQVTLSPAMTATEAWSLMGSDEGILESFVDFECEVSILIARRADGMMRAFPVVQNTHKNHILAETHAPAAIPPEVAGEATALAQTLAEKLDLVGLLAVEMFVLKQPNAAGQRVVMNEIAPRPHNSGHWTMDACACSQYEQLVRAVCGLPLGDPTPHSRAVMINLLGHDVDAVPAYLSQPHACVHLYGKAQAREGRKMGHVTLLKGAW